MELDKTYLFKQEKFITKIYNVDMTLMFHASFIKSHFVRKLSYVRDVAIISC